MRKDGVYFDKVEFTLKTNLNQIVVKNMVFADHIHRASYLFAILITVLFGIFVNLAMRRYIRRIPMAESLKAVE